MHGRPRREPEPGGRYESRLGGLQVSGAGPLLPGMRKARQILRFLWKENAVGSASFPSSAGARLPRGRAAPLPPAWRAASLSLRGSPPPKQMAVGRKLDALLGSRAHRSGGEGAPRGRPPPGSPSPGGGGGGCFDISSKEGT